MNETRVVYMDAEPNGLAMMLGGLIQANLAGHPERAALLDGKPSVFALVTTDAGVAASVRMSPGLVQVASGIRGRPTVVVEADSGTLLELSSAPRRFGMPDVMTPAGRMLAKKLATRELKVKGVLTGAGTLSRLSKLLAVG